jgi:prepilin peptidase CpaA
MDFNLISYPTTIIAIVLLFWVAIFDSVRGKIPNYLTFTGMAIGVGYYSMSFGYEGLLFSTKGLALGIGLLMVPWLTGGMGGGDVKLLGSVGSLLGPHLVFYAFLCGAIIGGLMAVSRAVVSKRLGNVLGNFSFMLKHFMFTRKLIVPEQISRSNDNKIPYGIAIALGSVIALAINDYHGPIA